MNRYAKIAFLFSGQGAQYPGMLKNLYEKKIVCRKVFETADNALKRPISQLCFSGSQESLNMTHNTQPCMLAADLAAYFAVKEEGILPDAAAGFSLGEYAALVASGVLRMEDAFFLIQQRADFMQEAAPVGTGAMAAVTGTDEADIRRLCEQAGGYVEPANYNCPGQIVVSGEIKAVEQVVNLARLEKKKAMILPVSAPFHCRLMEPAAEKLGRLLEDIPLKNPVCPIYMNVDAKPVKDMTDIKEKMISQAKLPVYWERIVRNMYADGIDTFIELGVGDTLSRFVKRIFKGIKGIRILHVSDSISLQETVKSLTREE